MAKTHSNHGGRGGTHTSGGRSGGGYNQPREAVQIGGKPLEEWKSNIKKWVESSIDKDTILFADDMGRLLEKEKLTTSQIRNVFGEMRKIQMNGFEKEKSSFLLLRAKLAYATKRQQAKGMDKFYDLFCIAYDAVDTTSENGPNHYDRLLQVMEAVLAYHKFHGGQ